MTAATIWRYYLGWQAVKYLAERQRQVLLSSSLHTPDIRIVILLPLLREQDNLTQLLGAIDALEFPRERVLIAFITTEREERDRKRRKQAAGSLIADLQAGNNGLRFLWKFSPHFAAHRLRAWAASFDVNQKAVREQLDRVVCGPSTNEAVARLLLDNSSRFPLVHIHYPNEYGNKASQMNYALHFLSERGELADPGRTYIGVYDADSRPPRWSLLALSMAANEDRAAAFQQYPIYLQDARSMGFLMRNEAWLHTSRSVCVEIPRQLGINAALARGRSGGKTFTYCIGHGEFMRADWLLRAGFPEENPIDDIPTGVMLSLSRQRIVPLPFCDLCTVPKSILDFFRQSATWFEGQSDYTGPYRRAVRFFGPVPARRRVRQLLEQVGVNALWAARGPTRALALFTALMSGLWVTSGILIGIFIAEAWSQWSVTRLLLDAHEGVKELPRLPFAWSSLTHPLFNSMGPCFYLFSTILGRTKSTYKTER